MRLEIGAGHNVNNSSHCALSCRSSLWNNARSGRGKRGEFFLPYHQLPAAPGSAQGAGGGRKRRKYILLWGESAPAASGQSDQASEGCNSPIVSVGCSVYRAFYRWVLSLLMVVLPLCVHRLRAEMHSANTGADPSVPHASLASQCHKPAP